MSRCFPFCCFLTLLTLAATAAAQDEDVNRQTAVGNKPERVQWFSGLGFGMFVHWSLDSQIGSVISHSLVGADEAYCRRYFEELPKTFHPRRFDPGEWADLARLAGMRYVVFTAKHHSGFCMFDTKTTDFSIMNTPYQKDITREVIEAFRSRGVAVGLYFSPDDFYFLYKQGIPIGRKQPGVTPQENPDLLRYDQAQLRELMTNYGPIDIVFLDGPAEGLREVCWQCQPDVVVTRGAMETPEQHIPGKPIPAPWEACMTMGTQWQFKPTNESYKSGAQLIERLIETRAKGGNFLLNVGPEPDGPLPPEQSGRLREIALWYFVNQEAVLDVEPWTVVNDGNIWYTQRKSDDGRSTVYAMITQPDWKWGARKEFLLASVRAGEHTQVYVLGQTGKVLEYRPGADVTARWEQKPDGLHVSAVRAQRLYNDRAWPNPVVLKITDARANP